MNKVLLIFMQVTEQYDGLEPGDEKLPYPLNYIIETLGILTIGYLIGKGIEIEYKSRKNRKNMEKAKQLRELKNQYMRQLDSIELTPIMQESISMHSRDIDNHIASLEKGEEPKNNNRFIRMSFLGLLAPILPD
jgi:hypothetical protein